MHKKTIKMKPKDDPKKNIPKFVVKSNEAVAKSVKDAVIRKATETKHRAEHEKQQPQKADTEAAESVENAAYTAADTAYHDGKSFVKNRIRVYRKNKVKSKAQDEKDTSETEKQPEEDGCEPKQPDNQPKTREKKEATAEGGREQEKPGVKTKEDYLKAEGENQGRAEPKTAQDARKEYVESKLKHKGKADAERLSEANVPKNGEASGKAPTAEVPREKVQVKTKESYMHALRQERVEPRQTVSRMPKEKTVNAGRSTAHVKKSLKTRENVVGKSNSVVKSGNAYTGKAAKKKTAKTAKHVAKTQKEATKKAAKEAAKRARQAAQKAAQIAKTVAIQTAKAVATIGKAIVAAAAKAVAAFFAAFGWIGVAIVLVILIVIIIVAAIAGSPFGIFISEEAADHNSIPISSIVNECNMELSARLTEIEDNTTHDRIVMEGEQADWSLVLSLFSVKVAGTGDNTAQDVVVIDEAKKQKLKEVFWDMHTISSQTETVTSGDTSEIVLYITITAKTKEQMVSQYGFDAKQKEALETLLENSDAYVGSMQSLAISDMAAQDVIDALPDHLSEERKSVVKKACSLVGKVTYFWGGKSSAIGWDSEWGKMKLVTAEGSRSTGCMRPFGLDCSGFVTWAFHNAGFSESAIGHGASTQASQGTRISWSSAQPGDLAVYDDESHIGIVAGKDSSGNTLVIHCSSEANNVVITTGGFGFVVRPDCY